MATGPSREGGDPHRLTGERGPCEDPRWPEIGPIATIISRAQAADREIEGQEQAAVFDEEGMQLSEAAPLIVRNHHTERAVVACLLNHMGRGEHGSAGIGNHSGAADASARSLMVFRT